VSNPDTKKRIVAAEANFNGIVVTALALTELFCDFE
jgi:hypothetical protein